MLIKVTVENFKSFSEPTEMTMISSTKIQKGTDHRVKIKSTNILKYAVIYGANAAGKSNLIDFFWFLKSTLNDTIPMVATKWFCKCKEENINKGKEVFEKELKKQSVHYVDIAKGESYDKFIKRYNINCMDDLYALVGLGAIVASSFIAKLKEENLSKEEKDKNLNKAIEENISKNEKKKKDTSYGFAVEIKQFVDFLL